MPRKESADDEILSRLPKAYQILVEFARERGLIGEGKSGQANPKRHEGGGEGSDER